MIFRHIGKYVFQNELLKGVAFGIVFLLGSGVARGVPHHHFSYHELCLQSEYRNKTNTHRLTGLTTRTAGTVKYSTRIFVDQNVP